MKHMLLPALTTLALSAGAPMTLNLSGEWAFAYQASPGKAVPEAGAFKATMAVPGAWDDRIPLEKAKALWPDAKFNPKYQPIAFPVYNKPPDASLPWLLGKGWYRRVVAIPAEWKGRSVRLAVGAVVTEGEVWVDGVLRHTHSGHHTDWSVEVGPFLKPGASVELCLAVDNTKSLGGTRLRGWVGNTGGIFAGVRLDASAGAASISDLWTTRVGDKVQCRLETDPKAEGLSVRWTLRDGKNTVAQGTSAVRQGGAVFPVAAKSLRPWTDTDPALYAVTADLLAGNETLQSKTLRFGHRALESRGRSLLVEGVPVYLRGHTEHNYFPETCTPALDVETYRKRLAILKSYGFNWLRFHTWFPPEPYLEAADELGMMIQVEGQDAMDMVHWEAMLRAGRRHPSVILYCLGNEREFDDARVADGARWAARQKEMVPDALFAPNSGERGILRPTKGDSTSGFAPDLAMEPIPHNPSRLAAVTGYSDLLEPHIWGMLSYSSLKGDPAEIERRLSIVKRPAVVHEAGIIGSFIDLSLEKRYEGTRIGPGLFQAARTHLEASGVLTKAPRYYRASVAWQNLIRKDMLENTRLCPSLMGYDLLGAVDMHWHRSGYDVGLLNEFFEPKPGVRREDILAVNGEGVPLLKEHRDHVFLAGASVKRTFALSWYGRETLPAGAFEWSLETSSGENRAKGKVETGAVPCGTVQEIASVTVNLPTATKPEKLVLKVRLASGKTALSNRWDWWVFPPAPKAKPSEVQVVTELTAGTLGDLTGGERVLLLGGGPLPVREFGFQQGIGGRTENNFATLVSNHPALGDFPHEGFMDWQFRAMAQGAKTVVFAKLKAPFDPIVEVANSYKCVIRQGALCEWRVGKGRLLVCTLNLSDDDPAGAWLKARLLGYLAGPGAPAPALAPDDLREIIAHPAPKAGTLDGDDQGFDPRTKEFEKKGAAGEEGGRR